METGLIPLNEIQLVDTKELEAAHAVAFKALHEGMYKNTCNGQLEILKANFSNLDIAFKSRSTK